MIEFEGKLIEESVVVKSASDPGSVDKQSIKQRFAEMFFMTNGKTDFADALELVNKALERDVARVYFIDQCRGGSYYEMTFNRQRQLMNETYAQEKVDLLAS